MTKVVGSDRAANAEDAKGPDAGADRRGPAAGVGGNQPVEVDGSSLGARGRQVSSALPSNLIDTAPGKLNRRSDWPGSPGMFASAFGGDTDETA
jgi:hypothetical protein